MAENNFCNGSSPRYGHRTREVRLMKLPGDSNLILCKFCWDRELKFRRERNRHLSSYAQYDLPDWDRAEVYVSGQ